MPNLIENACRYLEGLHRFDLAILVLPCKASFEQVEDTADWFGNGKSELIFIRAPVPIDDALRSLPQFDRKRIAEAVSSGLQGGKSHSDIKIETLDAQKAVGAAALLSELLINREMMISVATGGARIQDVEDHYRARDIRIRRALPLGITYANPHQDLWSWYKHWNAHLPQWKDRRAYIKELFAPSIEAIAKCPSLPSEPRETTGWERVDRALSRAREQFEMASAEEDYQAIGLLCREVIISLAQAVYNYDIHGSLDGITPSETDANRMLEAFIAHAFPGASNKEIRAHHRASLALALNLQHRRTATRQLAALCIEATASTTTVVSIIARSSSA